MLDFANDLYTEGRIANDLISVSDDFIIRHRAAVYEAARAEQSQTIARLLGDASKAIGKFFAAIHLTTDMEAHRFNKSVKELEGLSDELLADIGVERRMIREIVRANIAAEKQSLQPEAAPGKLAVADKTTPQAVNCNKADRTHLAA